MMNTTIKEAVVISFFLILLKVIMQYKLFVHQRQQGRY